MKKLATIFLVLLLGAGGLFFYAAPTETPAEDIVSGPNGRDIGSAARTRLGAYAANIDAEIATLIVGETSQTETNAWNFRGALKIDVSTRTVFGTIQNIYDNFANPDCWQLATLAIDGEFQTLAIKDVETSAEDESRQVSTTAATSVTTETVVQNTDTAAMDETITVPDDLNSNSVVQAIAPEIWFTKTNNVNGRTGPGTDFSVAFRIPTDVPLTFVEKQDKWGLFSYAAQGGGEGRIWVSLSLVQKQ